MNPFNETCQGTLPISLGIIGRANSFEEAIRYAIAVGGYSDTIGAIVGAIAEAIWVSRMRFTALPSPIFPTIYAGCTMTDCEGVRIASTLRGQKGERLSAQNYAKITVCF